MAEKLTVQAPNIEVKPSMTDDDLYSLLGATKDSAPSQPMSSEDLLNILNQKPVKAEEEKMPWSDVAAQAYHNIIPSGIEMGKNLYGAVRHPITTAGSILDLATGGIHNLMPEDVAKWIDTAVHATPEETKKAVETANAVGKFYKERYGSGEGFKKALAQDPVGVASDLSALLTGGASIASKAGLDRKSTRLNSSHT